MTIKENISHTLDQIENAKSRSGNTHVQLVAVSKNHSAEAVMTACEYGLDNFGENRIQEALPKIAAVEEAGFKPVWHMVGHLQGNKARKAAGPFHWVQSLDKLKTAERLDRALAESGKTMRVLIEVNTSSETAKNGIAPDELNAFAEGLAGCKQLVPSGLMTIGPLGAADKDIHKAFALLRTLKDNLQRSFPGYRELSMGMSGDYSIAIEEGATIVRIGSGIFGPRQY